MDTEIHVEQTMNRLRVYQSSPRAFLINHQIQILQEDGFETIGKAQGLWIPSICDNVEAIILLDAVDQDFYARGEATLRHEEDFDEYLLSWYSVSHIQIDEPYRGNGFGHQAMCEMVLPYQNPGSLTVIQPGPIITKPGYMTEGEKERATQSLQQYWHDFGFRPIPWDPRFYFHIGSLTWPHGSWMMQNYNGPL